MLNQFKIKFQIDYHDDIVKKQQQINQTLKQLSYLKQFQIIEVQPFLINYLYYENYQNVIICIFL